LLTMHGTNPYAQAGWYNPQNPMTINTQPWGVSSISGPSVFGALPYPSNQSSIPTVLTFHYVCLNPDILNCMITGPTSIPFLEVVTMSQNGIPTTVFKKSDGRALASIEWGYVPTVEILQRVNKQAASQWMRATSTPCRRLVTVGGREFAWVIEPTGTCVYGYGNMSKALVKLHKGPQAITLELTTEAFNAGLLEVSIVAAVLLHSGRHFG
ncbi:hypothetical protein BKA70DRAFT_1261980, partial [Coprinopsis sp. MPI-PUGE-AT-0042]